MIKRPANKSCIVFGIVIIIYITSFMLIGCSTHNDREHIVQKVKEIYGHLNGARVTLNKIDHELSSAKTEAEESAYFRKFEKLASQTNEKCMTIVLNDPVLKAYFESVLQKLSVNAGEELTIQKLNFFVLELQEVLEDDLKIKLTTEN